MLYQQVRVYKSKINKGSLPLASKVFATAEWYLLIKFCEPIDQPKVIKLRKPTSQLSKP